MSKLYDIDRAFLEFVSDRGPTSVTDFHKQYSYSYTYGMPVLVGQRFVGGVISLLTKRGYLEKTGRGQVGLTDKARVFLLQVKLSDKPSVLKDHIMLDGIDLNGWGRSVPFKVSDPLYQGNLPNA